MRRKRIKKIFTYVKDLMVRAVIQSDFIDIVNYSWELGMTRSQQGKYFPILWLTSLAQK